MKISVLDKSQFLNVDLDIHSRSDLQPLVEAMGERIIDLWVGRVKRHYEAHLELQGSHRNRLGYKKSPESLILGFCGVIRALPPEARALWDNAKSRSFDVGIEASGPYKHYWFSISTRTIAAALEVNAQIAVTVYGPLKKARSSSKSRGTASAK